MRPTRLTQPYRASSTGRNPGAALTQMTRGRTMGGYNPQDLTRSVQRLMRAKGVSKRPQRPVRPERPQRPAR